MGGPSDDSVSSGMALEPLPSDHKSPHTHLHLPLPLTATCCLLCALHSRPGSPPSNRPNVCPCLRAFVLAVPPGWAVHCPRVLPVWLLHVIQVPPPKPSLQRPAWITMERCLCLCVCAHTCVPEHTHALTHGTRRHIAQSHSCFIFFVVLHLPLK